VGSAGPEAVFTSEPLEQDVRIAGLPQLALQVTPSTPVGGHVFAELYDIYPDGRSVRLSWAAMNLRFADGGNTQPVELTPGQPVAAMMEFEPTDAHLGQGHRLRLAVHRHGVEDILASPTMEPAELGLGGGASVLRLPLVQREDALPSYRPPGLG
jgi:predicted acyl esterase